MRHSMRDAIINASRFSSLTYRPFGMDPARTHVGLASRYLATSTPRLSINDLNHSPLLSTSHRGLLTTTSPTAHDLGISDEMTTQTSSTAQPFPTAQPSSTAQSASTAQTSFTAQACPTNMRTQPFPLNVTPPIAADMATPTPIPDLSLCLPPET
jgi:hypothetical protein